jgi:hypothetical protein
MIRDTKILKKFEDGLLRKEHLSYDRVMSIFEALWNEAASLGVLPLKDPMEGIEVKIKLAKVLNSCSRKS